MEDWAERAGTELAAHAGAAGGWGYRAGGTPFVEPTALAALALLAHMPSETAAPAQAALARHAADWLTQVQRADGSLGLSLDQPTPGWMTPYAMILWQALGLHPERIARGAEWLLAQKGRTLPRTSDVEGVAGHDTTIVGWPWVDDTHSWLEPTALAVLALSRAGFARHARVVEGLKLIRDRAIGSGGWNYGNRAVFGRSLRAQPAPTGLALLALATVDPPTKPVKAAIRYLREALPGVRAPMSLSWGLIGLRAWNATPDGARGWLAEAYAAVAGRPDAAPRIAPLLLADAPGTLALFGRAIPDGGHHGDRT